jgi:hypothetical protein
MNYNLLFGLLLILPCAGGAICTMLPTPNRILAAMCATVLRPVVMMPIVRRVITGGPVELSTDYFMWMRSAFHLCVMAIVFVASSIYA